jgi:beta-mannosidase
MVWQEFHQSSSGIDNEPARDAEYAQYCAEQARRIVPRRTHHPSLVMWCGGNELMDADQRPCDGDHPVLAALGRVVAEEDPQRIYLPTSPSGPVFAADPKNLDRMHDVHGHWLYLGDPDHYAFYNAIDPLLHSEFGCEGAANLRALETFLTEPHRWPPDRTNAAWVHHGNWWLCRDKVAALFGPVEDLRTFVFTSQWMQHEGLRYIAEAARRRKWRTSGCAPWQLNESWPNASCTNCLDYYGAVRPAYWGMRGAYAPLLVSLRYDRLSYAPGSVFEAECWLNVTPPHGRPAAVRWVAWDLRTCASLADDRLVCAGAAATPDGAAERLGAVSFALPDEPTVFGVALWADGDEPASANRYVFSTQSAPIFAAAAALATVEPVVDRIGTDAFRISCPRGLTPLIAVRADGLETYDGPYLSWGYAPFLMPGEVVRVDVSGRGAVEVSALNGGATRVSLT